MDYHADPVEHAARYYDRLAREAEQIPQAEAILRADFNTAFMRDVTAKIQTPGWGRKQREGTVAEIAMDLLASPKSEKLWPEILTVIAKTAQGEMAQADALRIVNALADDHAEYHAADYVYLQGDDSDDRCTDAYDCGGPR